MNIEKELFINGRQPLYGCKGTYTGDFFQALIDECSKHFGGAAGNPLYLMSQSFTYGIIQGKRLERARRRGEPFDIDRELTNVDVAEELGEMVTLLREMSIKEIKQVHALALKEIQPGEKATEYLNKLVAGIIADKEKEGVAKECSTYQ